MSEQYPGGFITKSPPTPAGPYENSSGYGIWNLSQQAAYTAQGLWPTAGSLPPDPQFNYVTMLLHGDGTNGAQNNTFVDSSSNNFTITRNGNTTQGSFSPYGSNWSSYTNGGYSTTNTSLTFSSDFTFELWVNPDLISSPRTFFSVGDDASTGITFYAQNGELRIYAGGAVIFQSGNNDISSGSWNHVAMVRSSGTIKVYKNGVQTGSSFSNANTFSGTVTIAAEKNSGAYYNPFGGYISNLRLNTTAVYSTTFTPSTTPLTAISGTTLLVCQSNRFIDNSSNNATITLITAFSNAPSIQRFNPFGASTAYDTSVIGGSGYFDGTGDYLSVPNNTALQILGGSFTLDCWIYLTAAQANMGIIGIHDNSTAGYFIRLDTTIIRFYTSAATVDRTYAFAQNTWYHIAVVSSGTTGTLYINGVAQGATFSTNGTQDTTDQFIIGKTTTLTNNFVGYISDVRVIKGSAVTPPVGGPTSPLTAVTNTQLLCNFTNAAIYDNAEMNDLETVGNAQISTSVKKYGTGSMSFDGNTATLYPIYTPNLNLSSGDFTFEAWIYTTNSGNYQLIFATGYDNASSYATLRFHIYSGGLRVLMSTDGSSWQNTSTFGSISNNTWTHVAVVRYGSSIKVYIDGTGYAVATYSGNYYAGSQAFVGNLSNTTSNYPFSGYIDDLRITKGYARYTTTFTPPTAAFPNTGPN